jgi:hypothetical protein
MVGNTRKCFISIACPFAVECAVRRGSVHSINESAEALIVASYGDWSRSADNQHMVMSRDQNAGQNYNKNIDNYLKGWNS